MGAFYAFVKESSTCQCVISVSTNVMSSPLFSHTTLINTMSSGQPTMRCVSVFDQSVICTEIIPYSYFELSLVACIKFVILADGVLD